MHISQDLRPPQPTLTPCPPTALPLVLFCLLVLLAIVIAAAPAHADLGAYTIEDFDTEVTVEADSDLRVEERIVVNFAEPRHGIYRSIPFSYTDPRGYQYSFRMRFDGVVDDDGRRHGTQVSRSGGAYRIRIGDADRRVEGRVVYRIRYRVENALGHFPEYDEIYWNATGNEWATDIRRATATIRLPAPLPADSLRALGFTGAFGSTERAVTITHPAPGVIRYEATRPLGELEGLTVVAAFPRGHVTFPGTAKRATSFIASNIILVAPFLWLFLLVRLYRSKGKDPEGAGSIVVRYEPPPDLTPAEVGTIIDERVDLRDITATVVDLAVKGHLEIEENEEKSLFGLISHSKTTFIKRENKSPDDLLLHETRVADGIFRHGEKVDADDLKQEFYREIPKIRSAVVDRLVKNGYFDSAPHSVRSRYVLFGILAGLATFFAGFGLARATGGIFPYALALPIGAAVVSAILFFAFAPAMPRRTRKGVAGREWALGFQEFATRVEADRIERDLADRDQRRTAFERLLPYAMALGVGSAWARRFRDIYEEGRPPVWYHGTSLRAGFSAAALEKNLSASMANAETSMSSTPRSSGSSGSGGGGSSGGGGGGGGGGSW